MTRKIWGDGNMTVKELREKLSNFNDDMNVYVEFDSRHKEYQESILHVGVGPELSYMGPLDGKACVYIRAEGW